MQLYSAFIFLLFAIVAESASLCERRGKQLDEIAVEAEAPSVLSHATEVLSNGKAPVLPSLMTDMAGILQFLHIVQDLKLNKRTGWHLCGIPYEKTESIADHMFRMAIMVCMVQDDSIDKFKAVKMALVHDMAEAIVGDITPACGVSEEEKYRLESEAMEKIKNVLGDNPFGAEAQELWTEYAANFTPESQFVKDIDKTELYVQVCEYENIFGINFQGWLDNSRPKIRHPGLQAIADFVELERPKEFLDLKAEITEVASATADS